MKALTTTKQTNVLWPGDSGLGQADSSIIQTGYKWLHWRQMPVDFLLWVLLNNIEKCQIEDAFFLNKYIFVKCYKDMSVCLNN